MPGLRMTLLLLSVLLQEKGCGDFLLSLDPLRDKASLSQPINYSYTIKLINPTRMSEYKNVEIQGKANCSSINELKEFVSTNHPSGVDMPNLVKVEMGYIEPGHGGKGRKVWIFDDGDVQRMYEAYTNKKWILLWCYTEPIQKKVTDTQEKSDGAQSFKLFCASEKARSFCYLFTIERKTWDSLQTRAVKYVGPHATFEDP